MSEFEQREAAGNQTGPRWWIRDGVLALVIGAALLGGQWIIDDWRSNREIRISAQLADAAERRENIRFIRDRSSNETIARPFAGMDLRDQNFVGLQMLGADLRSTDLTDARLEEADLSDARFSDAEIYATDFTGAKLTGANFACPEPEDSLCFAFIGFGDFSESNLNNARLSGLIISATDFSNASLRQADLSHVHLNDTVLFGADLTNANLTGIVFRNVCYDLSTEWPIGFTPPPPGNEDVCIDAITGGSVRPGLRSEPRSGFG